MSETPKPEEKPQEKKPSTEQPQPEQTLMERITGVIDDVMKAKLTKFEKTIDDKIETIIKAKEIEIEQALRKTFGTEKDPVIHASDLTAALRKLSLEQTDATKKTPGPLEKAGPEGTATPEHPIDKLLKEYGMTPQGGKK